MKSLKENLELKILSLENQQKEDLLLFKEDIHLMVSQLNPLNIVKNAFSKENDHAEGIGNTILIDIIGISMGYISKKLMFGATNNPFKKLFGTMLQFGVAKFVSNHKDRIQAIGEVLTNKIGFDEKEFLTGKNKMSEIDMVL
jgi:hypothetical protein